MWCGIKLNILIKLFLQQGINYQVYSLLLLYYTKRKVIAINTSLNNKIYTSNPIPHFYYKIDKLEPFEYIINNTSFVKDKEDSGVEEKLTDISKEDETLVTKYLLDIMKAHDIITEEEYTKVLTRCNEYND